MDIDARSVEIAAILEREYKSNELTEIFTRSELNLGFCCLIGIKLKKKQNMCNEHIY